MGSLPCPKCQRGPLKWITDIEAEDLLDSGVMECQHCKERFKGIPGWEQGCRAEIVYPPFDENEF